ncbi:hypothetical protein [Streptomyces pacificus]|uniref:Uncharacterized protein n=1 Tax=Streptomyces pacificus TaxID=2705029 RepID=A0A6A0AW87_9ACTN|nr:hypothetical protein [Streptomyces pacificus]GFH36611.1 hypothetical protein SCWH03_28420 [Streptomyces pacificus]
MTERTEPLDMDALLARILSEPTRAHQLLHTLADTLDQDPFVTMGPWHLCDALNTAITRTLAGFPEVVVAEATVRVGDALPAMRPNEAAGEYALRLRDAARGLR